MRGQGGWGFLVVGLGLSLAVVGGCVGRGPLVGPAGDATDAAMTSAGSGGTATVPPDERGIGPTGVGGEKGNTDAAGQGTGSVGGGPTMTPTIDASVVMPGDARAPGSSETCAQLEADYVVAVEAAKACDPTSSTPQCAKVVIPTLCGGCSTLVNDTALPTSVRIAWDKVPCPLPPRCGPTCLPTHAAARCLPTSDGAGRCVDVTP
jgi:hypothetical protein